MTRIGMVLVGALVMDWLGMAPRSDMYSALIVDAQERRTAERILSAAYGDSTVTDDQWRQLEEDLQRNHGDPIQ